MNSNSCVNLWHKLYQFFIINIKQMFILCVSVRSQQRREARRARGRPWLLATRNGVGDLLFGWQWTVGHSRGPVVVDGFFASLQKLRFGGHGYVWSRRRAKRSVSMFTCFMIFYTHEHHNVSNIGCFNNRYALSLLLLMCFLVGDSAIFS